MLVSILTSVLVTVPTAVVQSAPVAFAASATPAEFVSLSPTRILDTRIGLGAAAGVVPAGHSIDLQVAGVGGVPIGATAVALNLTATDSLGAGYVTAWPSGSVRPTVSSLNLQAAGATVANLVVVVLPSDGVLSLFTQSGASLVADISGYWIPAPGGISDAGRFNAQRPARILDTRDGTGAPAGMRNAGESVVFSVAGQGGVPATGASAAVLVVTATDARAAGFVSAWPSQTPQPLASVLNLKSV
ncbi:MAG: hypothetical protein ABIZ69_00350, partial [Ilumatobacteraceae bacterium]